MAQPVLVVHQHSDSSNAVLIECIAGFFGLYGIGWLMSGYTTTGMLLLIGGLVWSALVWGFILLTFGFGIFALACAGPIDLAIWITSALILNSTLKKRALGIVP